MKIIKFIILTLIISIVGTGVSKADTLEELQKKQAEIDQQIQANKNAISSKQREINTTQNLISYLDDQISTTQRDIDLSTRKINITLDQILQKQTEIAQKQKELDLQKANLFETVKVYYENGQQSTMEIIVGSNSLNDMVNRTQYLEALSTRLDEQITIINQIKSNLEKEKTSLEGNKTDLEKQKSSLIEKQKGLDLQKEQKNNILNQDVAQKNNFQATLAQLQKDKSTISAEIYAARRAKGDIIYGTSDYPFGSIDVPDPWGFLTRECTSYAAWYWNSKLGKRWVNTQPGRGSARYWDEIAGALGYSVSSTPRVGAIISWKGPLYSGDQWGHVAIVESVNGNGTIDLSEMNWVKYSYSFRQNVKPGDYGSYVYIY